MSKCLVTKELIDAVEWCQNAPDSIIKPEKGGDGILTWSVKAIRDLKDKLARKSYTMSEPAKQGIFFENFLYDAMEKHVLPYNSSEFFEKVYNACVGGETQRKGKFNTVIGGEECCVYGKEDVFFPDRIIDIKTTGKWVDERKYTKTIQHHLYCTIEQVWDFSYIVIVWDKFPNIKQLKRIDLKLERDKSEMELHLRTIKAFQYLKDVKLWELYRDSYCLY